MTLDAPCETGPDWSLDDFRRSEDNLAFARAINPKGFHQIAYHSWGAGEDPCPVMCVHGLTRHGGDFDLLAKALAKTRRVICPDLVGRGASDWLPDPTDYHVPQYNCDLTTVMATTGCSDRLDWVGTSLGGLCGIVMAGLPNSPIRRLVINDVAPEVPRDALRRVSEYLSSLHRFSDYGAAERHLREVYADFGPMSEADWRHMAHTSFYRDEDQKYAAHFDPNISVNFRKHWLLFHFKLWTYWQRITCPIFIIRGTRSDFLTDGLLARMLVAQPGATVIEVEGVGHTPTLNTSDQTDPIVNWLNAE